MFEDWGRIQKGALFIMNDADELRFRGLIGKTEHEELYSLASRASKFVSKEDAERCIQAAWNGREFFILRKPARN